MKVNCPFCSKELIRLEPYEESKYRYWCDVCNADINIEKNEEAKDKVIIIKAGEKYKHFKGFICDIIAVATHTETKEKFVVYKHDKDDKVFARPYDMFISEVDHEKYPNVTQKYRFEKISN